MSENSLEALRQQYPNDKTAQDHAPISERPRVQAQNARIAWMKEHKPTCVADWFNYNRRSS